MTAPHRRSRESQFLVLATLVLVGLGCKSNASTASAGGGSGPEGETSGSTEAGGAAASSGAPATNSGPFGGDNGSGQGGEPVALSSGKGGTSTDSVGGGRGGLPAETGTSGNGGTPTQIGVGGRGGASSIGVSTSGGASTTSGGAVVAGRSAGICPGGTYPVPDLSSAAILITSDTAAGQYEGALWLAGPGVLVFSGMNTAVSATTVVPSTVLRLTPPSAVDTPVSDSGTNGLAIDQAGNLLAGSQKARGIVRLDLGAGTVATLVDTDQSGHRFNSVNDLTVRSDGTIYFTDPDYQLSGRTNETGIKGIYRYSPAKQVALVDGTFGQPNGITLSPDESVLYVADTSANRIRKFAVTPDGATSGKTDFATVTSPDGGAIDCAGNLYWASNSAPGKIYVFSPAGTQLGTIALGNSDKPTNVAFGGADRKTLYVTTAPRKIYSVALNIPGFPY